MAGASVASELQRDLHMMRVLVAEVLEEGPLRRDGGGLTFAQLAQLRLIGARQRHEAWTIGELARLFAVSLPAASKAVNRLERDGWVEIVPSPADARARCVHITVQGTKALARHDARAATTASGLAARLGPTRLRRASRALQDLIGAILEEDEHGDLVCLRCGLYDAEGGCVATRYGAACRVGRGVTRAAP